MGTFRSLVEEASSIVIISHYNPDPDAVGSALGLYSVLRASYPEKRFAINMDGPIGDFSKRFPEYVDIENAKPQLVIAREQPDLIIFTDATGYGRFDSAGGEELKSLLDGTPVSTIWIDHHEIPAELPKHALYVNSLASSASEQVVELLLSEGYTPNAQACLPFLVGMIADTGRFLYPNNQQDQTFRVLSYIFKQGITMQDGQNCLDNLKTIHTTILSALLKSCVSQKSFNYSVLQDSEVQQYWEEAGQSDFSIGTHLFTNSFLTSINQVGFGFVLHKDMLRSGFYKGSFRSKNGIDCNILGKELGGGGHKGAAGFGFQASGMGEALSQVLKILQNHGLSVDEKQSLG